MCLRIGRWPEDKLGLRIDRDDHVHRVAVRVRKNRRGFGALEDGGIGSRLAADQRVDRINPRPVRGAAGRVGSSERHEVEVIGAVREQGLKDLLEVCLATDLRLAALERSAVAK